MDESPPQAPDGGGAETGQFRRVGVLGERKEGEFKGGIIAKKRQFFDAMWPCSPLGEKRKEKVLSSPPALDLP